MPFGDRTGPFGMGPMTKRGMGYCTGFPTPGFMNPGFGGRTFRWLRRMGAYPFWPGWGNYPPYPPYGPEPERAKEAELEFLKREAQDLEMALSEIKRRIEELEKKER